MQNGTRRAVGSSARSAAEIALPRSPSRVFSWPSPRGTTRDVTSEGMSRRSSARNSSSWPGTLRQSIRAWACAGMTLGAPPARRATGVAVWRNVAPMILPTSPTAASALSGSSVVSLRPNASPSRSRNSRVVGVSRRGNGWSAMAETVRARTWTALRSLSIEPCPASPFAVNSSVKAPFWAVSSR